MLQFLLHQLLDDIDIIPFSKLLLVFFVALQQLLHLFVLSLHLCILRLHLLFKLLNFLLRLSGKFPKSVGLLSLSSCMWVWVWVN